MESSIWVAVTTILPFWFAFLMMLFWMIGTSSSGTSTPRSPRATMTPSASSRISSMLLTPWTDSILAMIFMRLLWAFRISRISLTSFAVLVKEAAIKSYPSRQPNSMSERSCLLMKGMVRSAPGRFTPLWLETGPPLMTVHTTSVSVLESTLRPMRPSSIKTNPPTETSVGRSL